MTGMLWFDNSPTRTLAEMLEQAARYYEKKYGGRPDLAWVHRSLLTEPAVIGGITVAPSRNILPHHLWLGKKTPEKEPAELVRDATVEGR